MGTLAYDPERLALLATALGAAIDDLTLLRSVDSEAQPAISVAATAGAAFDGWRSTAVAISGCAALVDYRPITLDAGDLALATEYVLATLYGWQTVSDATGSTRTVPPEMEAAAIGYLLSHGEIALDTPEQVASLQARLDAILADPTASSAFANNLTLEGAADLADRLASTRAATLRPVLVGTTEPPELPDDIAAEIAAIDGILGHLASTLVDSSAPLASARELLGLMRPYSAALVLTQLNAPSDVIGELAVDTMTRYAASFASEQPPNSTELPDSWYLGIGDLLLPKVAAGDPVVANDVVRRLMDLNPSTLLDTVRYPTSTTGLITRATDPSAIDVSTAGVTIRRYLDFLAGPLEHTPLPSSTYSTMSALGAQRGELAAVIAPWLLQFTSRVADWAWDDTEADDMLDWVVDNEGVLDDLLARNGNWADSVRLAAPGDPDELDRNLQEVASMLGEIETFLREHAMENAKSRQAMWDFMVQLIPKAVGKSIGVLPTGKVAGTIIVKGTEYGVDYIADLAQEHGWLGSPPPLDDVLRNIDLVVDQSRAVAAYLSVGAMTDALIKSDALPADATWPPPPPDVAAGCPSKDYFDSTTEWLDEQYPDRPMAHDTLEIALLRFLNDAGTASSCQELQLSGAAD